MAGVVRDEAFLNSQLQIAGGSQSRILENLQKNKNTMKSQALAIKIVYGIMLSLLPVMPLIMYFYVLGIPLTPETLTIISVTLIILYLGMTPVYVIILGINTISGFMSGDVFEWVEILPISRSTLRKVEFIVIWRFFDIPLLAVVFVFPILMAWATGSVVVFFVCLGVSVLNAIFLFCVLILVTEKFTRIMKGSGTNSRKASIIRIVAMLGYAIVAGSGFLFINLAIQSIGTIIQSLATMENVGLTNILLSVIPFPFAPAYLIAFIMFPTDHISFPLLGSTLIGICLLVLLTWRMCRLALLKMRNLTSHQARNESLAVQKMPERVEIRPIKPVSPVKALTRKDIASITRDFQGTLFLLFPLLFPFIIFLQAPGPQGSLSLIGNEVAIYNFLLIFLVMLTIMSAGFLISGLLGIEDSGASVLASLPVVPRDQTKAKLKIICTVQLASSLLPMVVFAWQPEIGLLIPLFLAYCPVSMAIVLLTFVTKIRLFGKMRYKYVLEEVNQNRKAWKWVAILGLDGTLLLGLLVLFFFKGDLVTHIGIVVILAASGIAGLFLVLWAINRICPKGSTKSTETTPG